MVIRYEAGSARNRLSPKASFLLVASLAISFLAGSSAPTPVYALYQAQWGFSSTIVTVIFGIYALSVLGALLVVGRLSDHLGRKPVLLTATVVQAGTMLLFAFADGLGALLAARVIQGLAAGAALGAIGAALIDLDKGRGTTANAVAPPLGTALGAIVAGLLVQYLPGPTHLVYFVLASVFVVQAALLVSMNETHAARPGAWASLKPHLRLPHATRGPMLIAIPALVATWALAGFYASLGPALVKGMLGTQAPVIGGLTLFVLASSGAVAVLFLQSQDARRLLQLGAGVLLVGVATAMAGLTVHSLGLFFVGTSLAGMGFGAGFQGAIRSVVTPAAAHERAGVLSVALVVSYLAMGLPAMVAGYFVTRQGNILATAQEFGVAIMMLAALALYGTVRGRATIRRN